MEDSVYTTARENAMKITLKERTDCNKIYYKSCERKQDKSHKLLVSTVAAKKEKAREKSWEPQQPPKAFRPSQNVTFELSS
jgi:hypothetical protein